MSGEKCIKNKKILWQLEFNNNLKHFSFDLKFVTVLRLDHEGVKILLSV